MSACLDAARAAPVRPARPAWAPPVRRWGGRRGGRPGWDGGMYISTYLDAAPAPVAVVATSPGGAAALPRAGAHSDAGTDGGPRGVPPGSAEDADDRLRSTGGPEAASRNRGGPKQAGARMPRQGIPSPPRASPGRAQRRLSTSVRLRAVSRRARFPSVEDPPVPVRGPRGLPARPAVPPGRAARSRQHRRPRCAHSRSSRVIHARAAHSEASVRAQPFACRPRRCGACWRGLRARTVVPARGSRSSRRGAPPFRSPTVVRPARAPGLCHHEVRRGRPAPGRAGAADQRVDGHLRRSGGCVHPDTSLPTRVIRRAGSDHPVAVARRRATVGRGRSAGFPSAIRATSVPGLALSRHREARSIRGTAYHRGGNRRRAEAEADAAAGRRGGPRDGTGREPAGHFP